MYELVFEIFDFNSRQKSSNVIDRIVSHFFLLVHCSINALMFLNDGGLFFNEAAHFMATNILIRTIEIFLFLFLIIHILQSVAITRQNMKARTISYSGTSSTATSKWYSRSMGILGSLILVFGHSLERFLFHQDSPII